MRPVLEFSVPIEAGIPYHFHPYGVYGPYEIRDGYSLMDPVLAEGNSLTGTGCSTHEFSRSGGRRFLLMAEEHQAAMIVVYCEPPDGFPMRPVAVASE